jgi:hypothetical protein
MPLNVPGCGQGGLGSAVVNDQSTFVHEIGHGYGFIHTPCGNAGGTDANYPTYEPYGSASIGEYGLDIRNGNTFDPNTARDYMSYCNPTWMSLYQHRRLIGHARLDPRWINETPWWHEYYEVHPFVIPELWLPDPPPYEVNVHSNPVLNPVVSILGEVLESGDVKVHSVARVSAAGHPGGVDTRFMAQLVDDRGDVLARAPLVRLDTHGGCGCQEGGTPKDPNRLPLRFQAFLPDVAPGAALRIVDAATELWVRKAPAKAVTFFGAKVDVAGAEGLVLRWQLRGTEEADVWAQWSNNEGKTWHGLATGLTSKGAKGEATVPLTGLPAGPVLLRLLAHDGFFTAVTEMLSVALPPRAPELALLHPRDRQVLTENRPLQLAASATDSAGVPIPNEELRWSLDGTPIGHGREVWIRTPQAGEHTVVLTVRWSGGEVQRKATIRIERSPADRPPERRG